MSQALMQACIENRTIQKYVHHFAVKVHETYPRLLDVEDAKNDLWIAVFRAIQKRYTKQKPLIQFAKSAVFSQYGSMVKKRGNAARRLHESMDPDTELGLVEPFYLRIEANYTLDQIEKDLIERASASRQYRYAVITLRLLREGASIKECYEHLHISKYHGYKVFHEIIRKCSGKYRDESITIK